MNVNKGTEVFAIYSYGDDYEYYTYKKEKFVRYQNGFPVCTCDMSEGVIMGYEEICLTEKEAISRVDRLNKGH